MCDVTGGKAGAQCRIGLAQHLRVDCARADANGADAVLLALDGDRLGQPDNPVLGDVVGGQARELLGAVDARERADVDDPSLALPLHGREYRATAQEGAGQVDPERLFPDVGRGFSERSRGEHTSRADQCAGWAGLRSDPKEALDIADVADVSRDGPCLATSVPDVPGYGGESVAVPGGKYDARTRGGKGVRSSRPDPT